MYAINAPDADLRPEVKELVAIGEPLPVSNRLDENNAYFAVLGFQAPEDSDIVEIGNRIHTEYYNAINEDTLGKAGTSETAIGPAPSFISAIDIPQCDPEKPGALAFYNQAGEKHSQLFKENRLLLERYDSLRSYSEYQDLMRYTPWSSLARLTSAIYSAMPYTPDKQRICSIMDSSNRESI